MIDLSFLKANSKPVMIVGFARSGIATLRALQEVDIETFVYDDNQDTRKTAEEYGAIWVEKPLDFDFKTLAFIVLAPGIPLYYPEPHPICEKSRAENCPIISDIEMFLMAKKDNSTIVGITGTNGKSTTTALAEHVLKRLGKDVICGGNIGVAALALPENKAIYILEISSFQLDLCPKFRPHISILLNITPDHLDRHKDLQGYIKAKSIMFDGTKTNIIVSDDEYSVAIGKNSTTDNLIQTSFKDLPISTADLPSLAGEHNAQNIMAVYQICKTIIDDFSDVDFRKALETFNGLPHRQEIVPADNMNLLFINDSKATNADASAVALDTYKNIYWIAGGKAKDPKDFDALIKNHGGNIKQAFLIGAAANDLEYYLKKYNIITHQCETLDNAFAKAVLSADDNSSIVFSPACASFDQFLNFEQRGTAFTELVTKINQKKTA